MKALSYLDLAVKYREAKAFQDCYRVLSERQGDAVDRELRVLLEMHSLDPRIVIHIVCREGDWSFSEERQKVVIEALLDQKGKILTLLIQLITRYPIFSIALWQTIWQKRGEKASPMFVEALFALFLESETKGWSDESDKLKAGCWSLVLQALQRVQSSRFQEIIDSDRQKRFGFDLTKPSQATNEGLQAFYLGALAHARLKRDREEIDRIAKFFLVDGILWRFS